MCCAPRRSVYSGCRPVDSVPGAWRGTESSSGKPPTSPNQPDLPRRCISSRSGSPQPQWGSGCNLRRRYSYVRELPVVGLTRRLNRREVDVEREGTRTVYRRAGLVEAGPPHNIPDQLGPDARVEIRGLGHDVGFVNEVFCLELSLEGERRALLLQLLLQRRYLGLESQILNDDVVVVRHQLVFFADRLLAGAQYEVDDQADVPLRAKPRPRR